MIQILPVIMKCSKCGSQKIVAPCNEPDVDFRCLDCGNEKRNPKAEWDKSTLFWTFEEEKEGPTIVEI